jgi:hypothetical protein
VGVVGCKIIIGGRIMCSKCDERSILNELNRRRSTSSLSTNVLEELFRGIEVPEEGEGNPF